MMKQFLILTLGLVFLTSCGQETIKGNGNTTTETRNVSPDFNELESSGSFDVYIEDKPQDGKIKLEGESNVLEKIIVEVQGNKLAIKYKNGINIRNSKGVKISLNAKKLKSIGLSGSGNIKTEGVQNVENFITGLSGSGNIDVKVVASSVKVGISGSGDVKISGTSKAFEAGISGSGDIRAFELKSEDAKVAISGSGNVEISTNGELNASIAGSGDVFYKGKPTKLNVKAGGSGDVVDKN